MENLFTILPDLVGTFAFAISGIKLASGKEVDWLGAYIIGLATAIGGVIRDILLNEVPLLLQKDIYALACIIGGVVYFVCLHFSLSTGLTEIIAASVVILVRVFAVQFHIHLPILRALQSNANDNIKK